MKFAQKMFDSAHLNESKPFEHWGILHTQLVWAYDRVLQPAPTKSKQWDHISHPIPAWLVQSGEITLHLNTGKESYAPGTWVFPLRAPGKVHVAPNTRLLSIRFIADWPNGSELFPRDRSISFKEQEVPLLTQASHHLVERVNQVIPSQAPLDLEGSFDQYLQLQPAFYSWLVAYYEALTATGITPVTLSQLHEKTRIALLILQNQPLHEPFQERDLAQKVGISISQLNKLFHKELGFTPSSLWNKRRLMAIHHELAQGNRSVKSIAYEFGFSSPSNFTRWFQTLSGISPKDYRTQNSENQPV